MEQYEVQSKQDFRQWLADRNEVTVVFEEIARWKYIHTSLDNKDEIAKKEREFIIAEIRPKWAQHNHTLNQNSTTYRKDSRLRMRRVLIISTRYLPISKCFDENVSLGTQIQLKAREYDAISGNYPLILMVKQKHFSKPNPT